MSIRRLVAILIVVGLCLVLRAATAGAQTQWGQKTTTMGGQIGAPAWGTYQGRLGASGWQYNKALQPTDPKGALLSPNEIGGGPGTGTLYTPPDTRLLGRTAP